MSRPFIIYCALISLALLLAACVPGEPVDLLVSGGTVLTMDGERRVIEDGAVAVRGDRIVAVGTTSELRARYFPRKRIQANGGLILPGLINTHTHAAMALYRGAADDLTLQDWLTNYIFPLEAKLTTAEFVYWGPKLAFSMLQPV